MITPSHSLFERRCGYGLTTKEWERRSERVSPTSIQFQSEPKIALQWQATGSSTHLSHNRPHSGLPVLFSKFY